PLLFFFNHTPTTSLYTLSLHDALPIFDVVHHLDDVGGGLALDVEDDGRRQVHPRCELGVLGAVDGFRYVGEPHRGAVLVGDDERSEEHTSELQSLAYLVCRLLLEKKKK